jgi:hypothetical protein
MNATIDDNLNFMKIRGFANYTDNYNSHAGQPLPYHHCLSALLSEP